MSGVDVRRSADWPEDAPAATVRKAARAGEPWAVAEVVRRAEYWTIALHALEKVQPVEVTRVVKQQGMKWWPVMVYGPLSDPWRDELRTKLKKIGPGLHWLGRRKTVRAGGAPWVAEIGLEVMKCPRGLRQWEKSKGRNGSILNDARVKADPGFQRIGKKNGDSGKKMRRCDLRKAFVQKVKRWIAERK